jgi:Tfp pilus assembly protein PilN
VSQVNLLPPDIRRGQRLRRVTLGVLAAGAVVAALIFAFYLLQAQSLSSVKDDIRAQQTTNQQFQSEINDLQKFEDLQARAQQQQALLNTAYANEIAFSGLLMDLSRVIPSDAYLGSFGVTTTTTPAAGATTTPTTPTAFVGSITANGTAASFETISRWLTSLEQIEGWANPWVPSIQQSTTVPGAYDFSTSVDLTQDVLTARGAAAGGVVAPGG